MRYEFDKIIDRSGTNSVKWQGLEGGVAMWVADMDFACSPEILTALKTRLNNGIFGYSALPNELKDNICAWWQRRYGVKFEPDWLVFCSGVVAAISSLVRKFSSPGDKIVVQTPVYHAFFSSIINNGRQLCENHLKYDDKGYEIDFEDLENKLKDPFTTMMIICNPHNPVGKIWSKNELEKIANLCLKYDVLILCDEIHCDLSDPDKTYTPFYSLDEIYRQNAIICLSPSKSFNIAGLQGGFVVCENERLRCQIKRAFNADEIAENNAFSIVAMNAAYGKSEDWVDELRAYIHENKKFCANFIKENIPQISLTPSDATYLLWLDCSKICDDTRILQKFLKEKFKLWVSSGGDFRGNGDKFLRLNIALPRQMLNDGLNRLKLGADEFMLGKI